MRSKKAVYNLISYAIYEIVSFLKNIFIGHLILVAYGSDYNGLISSITQIISIFAIVRAGIFGATRVGLFKPLSNGDNVRVSRLVNTCAKSMRKITILLVVYVFVLAFVYPLFVNTNIVNYEVIFLVVLLGSTTIAEYLFGFSNQVLINADQSIYIYTIIQTILLVLSGISSYICISLDSSFVVMKTISCLITAIAPIVLSLVVRKKYNIKKGLYLDDEEAKQLSSNRKSAMWHALSTIVNDRADIVLITIFMTTKDVSVYSVYFLIVNVITHLFNSICDTFSASFGSMYANDEIEKFKKYYMVYEYIVSIFVILVFSCTIAMLCPFVSIYTKGVEDAEYILPIFAVLVASVGMLSCIKTPYYTVVVMAGHYQQTKKMAAVEPIVNLTASIILIKFLGLYGVLAGSIISGFYWIITFVKYSNNQIMLEKSNRSFVFLGMVISLTFGVAILQSFVLSFLRIDNYLMLMLSGFISITISGLVCLIYTAIFKRNEFKILVEFFKGIMKKKSA